jgi:SAM-dependent methyltransferase
MIMDGSSTDHTDGPASGRMYDYYLGGTSHSAADQESAQSAIQSFSTLQIAARENRAFLLRAVRALAAEAGIRQFLDLGAGPLGADSVHETVRSVAPGARVVYVDYDQEIVARGQTTLGGAPDGRTAYLHADLRAPEELLAHPAVRDLIDFTEPVALLLVAVLHFFPDEYEPRPIVRTLVDALPPGSHVVASHVTPEHDPEGMDRLVAAYRAAGVPGQARTAEELTRLVFDGLELLPPGVVPAPEWRPEGSAPRPSPAEVSLYGGVGRKPR